MSVIKNKISIVSIPISIKYVFLHLLSGIFLSVCSLSLNAAVSEEDGSKNRRTPIVVKSSEATPSVTNRMTQWVQDLLNMISSVISGLKGEAGNSDPNAPVTLKFISDQSLVMENSGKAIIKVVASKPSNLPISVFFTAVPDTAVAGADFNFRNGIWLFPAGKTEVELQIDIMNNSIGETDKSLSIAITNIIGAEPGSTLSHTVVIRDDDGAPPIIGGNNNQNNNENNNQNDAAEEVAEAFPTEKDLLAGIPTGAQQLAAVCNRMSQMGVVNTVTRAFCGATPPNLTNIKDLQRALGLDFQANGNNNPEFALTGHSSSLVMQFVNSINPRAIIFTPPGRNGNNELVAMGFVRGEQLAEIISAHFDPNNPNDPKTGELQFYLFNFEKTCNATDSCTNADLLTDEVERNWTGWTLYHEEDIKNTIADCRQCHQSGGPDTAKSLLMQELDNPWTHFFRNNTDGGRALLDDYVAAHGTDEEYAGIPGNLIRNSDPAELEDLVENNGFGNGFERNTNRGRFNTRQIENELENTGESATWQALSERNAAGEIIQVPYFGLRVTDPSKLQEMTQAYQAFKAGTITELPDIRDAFNESEMRNIGFKVKAGMDGAAILAQACTQCHNDNLDQSLSRARFNVDLSQMSVGELKIAQGRINLPTEHLRVMPPERFRILDAAERQLLTNYLQSVIDQKAQQ